MDDPPLLPNSDPASPVPASVSAQGTEERVDVDLSRLPDEHRDTVRRLYRKVEDAAETIERLRAENQRLRQRVQELEAQPAFPDAETVLALDDDPDELREQITDFINAIDAYLEATPDDETDSDEDDPDDPVSSEA